LNLFIDDIVPERLGQSKPAAHERLVILIFAEALGLYGLIVGLVVASTAEGKGKNLCSSYA